LPMFEPPIDPALLVRAVAAGLDLSQLMNEAFAPPSKYRFPVVLQRALELCNEVKGLGAAVLAAAEKREAEELTALRSGHAPQRLEIGPLCELHDHPDFVLRHGRLQNLLKGRLLQCRLQLSGGGGRQQYGKSTTDERAPKRIHSM